MAEVALKRGYVRFLVPLRRPDMADQHQLLLAAMLALGRLVFEYHN